MLVNQTGDGEDAVHAAEGGVGGMVTLRCPPAPVSNKLDINDIITY